MPITIVCPSRVDNDETGFNWLAYVASQLDPLWQDKAVFDGRRLRFFKANLCAPFGALLCEAQRNGNAIELCDVSGEVLKIWSKNEFWRQFGGVTMNDTFRTTLAYQQFPLQQDPLKFAEYIEYELMSRERDLPHMSDDMRQEFATSIKEIFDNAQSHSQSENGIFSCGQFFPFGEHIAFTLTDLGVGFRHNVEKRMGKSCSDEAAIEWATEIGHTTRVHSGGYGLAYLRQFFAQNNGRMQIVSRQGLWELNGQSTRSTRLRHEFPGSLVNLEINTADNSYHESLAESLNEPLF